MRNFIFEFDQQVILRLGLKLNELLFLDYVAQFINSGHMMYKFISGKRYYRLTYKKFKYFSYDMLFQCVFEYVYSLCSFCTYGLLEKIKKINNQFYTGCFFVVKFSAVKNVLTAGLINYKKKTKKFPVGSNGEPAGIVKCIYKIL